MHSACNSYGRNFKQRPLGKGALTLDTGNGTHITMVYFNAFNKSKDEILAMAKKYISDKWKMTNLKVETGEMWGNNSILVKGALADVKRDLVNYFSSIQEFTVDTSSWGTTPHIALKEKSKNSLSNTVNLSSGWKWM